MMKVITGVANSSPEAGVPEATPSLFCKVFNKESIKLKNYTIKVSTHDF